MRQIPSPRGAISFWFFDWTVSYNNFLCETSCCPIFAFSITSARPRIMFLNNSVTHLTPEDGCEVKQPKPSKLSSQQDEDKSPNNYSNNTIPSSTKLRIKPNSVTTRGPLPFGSSTGQYYTTTSYVRPPVVQFLPSRSRPPVLGLCF